MACSGSRVGALPVVLVLCLGALPSALATPAGPMDAPAGPAAPAVPAAAPLSVPASQDLAQFFPSIKDDLTKVTWAHAVNSNAELNAALNNTSILMLEADVILGKTKESDVEVPVMGHPPATESDLSLKSFLHHVVTYNVDNANGTRRGVKLDFKSIDVFEKAMDTLKETFSSVPQFPVWLNADILRGPVDADTTPVDAKRFLDKAKAEYPELMLSLGWTTRWGSKVANQSAVPVAQVMYSKENVDQMVAALKGSGVSQPITYAVRAAFVANSLTELKSLLNQTEGNATLTVWNSDPVDLVDVKNLRKNILEIGKNRVYLDVGDDLEKKLDLKSSAVTAYASAATLVTGLCALLLRAL